MAEERTAIALAVYSDPAMWQQVRLADGSYVWVFLCASDEEPWDVTAE